MCVAVQIKLVVIHMYFPTYEFVGKHEFVALIAYEGKMFSSIGKHNERPRINTN